MLGRQRASMEEGRVEGGNEQGMDGTRHRRREGQRKRAGEELSEERREHGSKGG